MLSGFPNRCDQGACGAWRIADRGGASIPQRAVPFGEKPDSTARNPPINTSAVITRTLYGNQPSLSRSYNRACTTYPRRYAANPYATTDTTDHALDGPNARATSLSPPSVHTSSANPTSAKG